MDDGDMEVSQLVLAELFPGDMQGETPARWWEHRAAALEKMGYRCRLGSHQVLFEAQAVVPGHSCPLKSPKEPETHPWRF